MYAIPFQRRAADREIGVIGTNATRFRLFLDPMHRDENIEAIKQYVGMNHD
jgi:hypothetical protein